MSKFKIGEIALATGRRNGDRDCEIIKLSSSHRWGAMQHYIIHVPGLSSHSNGGNWSIPEHMLRKKKPPKEELGSWKEVQKITEGWNPTKETENA